MAMPKNISDKWLNQTKTRLGCVIKTINDQPNPSYVELETEYNEAVAEKERWEEFADWVYETKKLRLNLYPTKFEGNFYQPNQLFVGKGQKSMTKEQAWKLYEESQQVA